MKKHQINLALAAIMIFAFNGCAGSRLRNMITRSDYMTVEELEAQDSLALEREEAAREKALAAAERELDSTGRDEKLVSQSRDLADGAEDSADEKAGAQDEKAAPRKSFFNIAGLFKRSEKADEVSPDPFVEVDESKAEETAVAAIESTEETKAEKATTAEKIDATQSRFSETIAAVEKESETVFEESANSIFDVAESDGSAEITAAEAIEKSGGVPSQSFSDFMADRQKKTVAALEKEVVPVRTAMTDASREVQTAKSEFDAIMSAGPQEAPASPFTSDLFPDLAAINEADIKVAPLVKAAEKTAAAAFDEFTEGFAAQATEPKQAQRPASADLFADASEKHGFNKLTQRDPWAAFNSSDQAPSPKSPEASPDAFGWSLPEPLEPEPVDAIVFSEVPRTETDASTAKRGSEPGGAFKQSVSPSPFSHISQSRVTQQPAQIAEVVHQGSAMGLVIPDAAASADQQSLPSENPFEPQFSEELASHDPAPVTEAVQEQTFAPTEPAESAAASSAPMGVRWTTRSWFLLIGCLLVIALLILPDRQNRKNG